jgi:hypothetical protein
MNIMNKNFFKSVVLLGLVFALAALPLSVFAQEAGQGLEISPPLIELVADPGQTIETQIRIRNVTDQALVANAQYNDFTSGDDEDGRPKLLIGENENEESPYTIKNWLTSIPRVTLQPSQSIIIKVVLTIPADASPGGHYGVIRFTGTPPEGGSNSVSLSASIGTLILVTVSGDVNEQAEILEIYTSHNDDKKSVFEYGPVTINTRLKNNGNIHIQPIGKIIVTNMFGRTVDTFEFNTSRGNVLPSSIRRFENDFNKRLLFGRYNIQADIAYGSQGTIIKSASSFWAIPYKLMAVVTVLIVLAVFGVRKYNQYIVKRAQKEMGDDSKKAKHNKKK